ncbi:sortase [Lactococcus termiticola]|uniref:Cell surface protein n=1 Tax=Lactococcus termiticola TaxID=2169526 RepID=A0A2R5HF38_9LACT|nr:sortase [Lactococcus termiticola]GBG95905.1 cell surface protein [Lactococcus termiticola]
MINKKILVTLSTLAVLSSGFLAFAFTRNDQVASQPEVKTEQQSSQAPPKSSSQKTEESAPAPSEPAVEAPAPEAVVEEPAPEPVEEVAPAPEPEPAPEPAAEAEAIVEAPSPAPTPAPEVAPAPAPAVVSQTISFLGASYHYAMGGRAGGQAAIDSNPGQASTWGGEASGNVADGLSTHFIGHEYGAFAPVLSLSAGQVITVVDSNGQSRNYTVNGTVDVDDHAIGVNDKVDYWDQITGAGGGERIVLQTCITNTINRIVFAS